MIQVTSLNGHSNKHFLPTQNECIIQQPSYEETYKWGVHQISFILRTNPDIDLKEIAEIIMETNPLLGNKVWDSIDLAEALDKTKTPREIEMLVDSALKLLDKELTSLYLE